MKASVKKGLYPTLAINGIKKNKTLYMPYILTCIGMIMMYYIISFLSNSAPVSELRGGSTVQVTLQFGSGVIGVFSLIFLFYTNSFLMRRRKKEFGLYNILGMNKWNIAAILVWETLIIFAGSFICGTVLGVAVSKLAELGLVNMMRGDVAYPLTISVKSIVNALILFGVIFALILINTLRQIHTANPIALLRSENVGEKPPKANWFLGIAGVILLAGAYYIALTIEDPIEALSWFFIAVLMVIVGTYLLFISGSVLICRLLQKNKKYYYKANHFVSVSSMAYRMKRNGAGLASICILVTMVLVMLSSTTCLYMGTEDSFNKMYPQDISYDVRFETFEDMSSSNLTAIKKAIADNLSSMGEEIYGEVEYAVSGIVGEYENGVLNPDVKNYSGGKIVEVYILSLDSYNKMTGTDETLAPGEAIIYSDKYKEIGGTFSIEGGKTVKIKKMGQEIEELSDGDMSAMGIGVIVVAVPDLADYIEPLEKLADYNGNPMLQNCWYYGFDMKASQDRQIEVYPEILAGFRKLYNEGNPYGISHYYVSSAASSKDDYYGSNGGLFFLGIMLSIVFLFAAVLIIYYKQVSEGYEDQARFEIMQNVGMTKREIRKSINSQMLTVFFLPLITAGIHLGFAFPFIKELLLLFGITGLNVLIMTTVISFLIFALFYVIVYKITSNAYYAIISGGRE